VAENQRKGAEALAKKGAVINLGWHEDVHKNDIINKFNELNKKYEVVHELSMRAKQCVDGLGASRVANILFFVRLPLAPRGFRFELIDGGHTSSILKWRNDERLNQHFIDRRVLTEADQRQFLENYFLKDRLDFVLVDENNNLQVGVFSLRNISSQPEIGQLIGETPYLGRGLGLAATEALVRFAFDDLGLEQVYARVNEKNAPNLKLLKKLNFSVVKQEKINDENYLLHEIRREDNRRWL
ncbi:MAG: GNAT family N-acetyltransferase, partial [Deltaproteobacteria bacterium]